MARTSSIFKCIPIDSIQSFRVRFELAASVLLDPLARTAFDEAHSDFEERWFTLGLASDGKLLSSASYGVRGLGFDKWSSTSAKIEPMLDTLLAGGS